MMGDVSFEALCGRNLCDRHLFHTPPYPEKVLFWGGGVPNLALHCHWHEHIPGERNSRNFMSDASLLPNIFLQVSEGVLTIDMPFFG